MQYNNKMSFRVLLLQELQDIANIDNQVIILYDEDEGSFFYYGLRKQTNIKYKGAYHYSRISNLVDFIKYTFDNFSQVVTHELHSIDISSCEYNSLNVSKLLKKISKSTELVAYDSDKLTYDELYNILNFMITHEV